MQPLPPAVELCECECTTATTAALLARLYAITCTAVVRCSLMELKQAWIVDTGKWTIFVVSHKWWYSAFADVQQMIYGGAVTWLLDRSTCQALNGWSADKAAHITGRTRREECSERTLCKLRLPGKMRSSLRSRQNVLIQ